MTATEFKAKYGKLGNCTSIALGIMERLGRDRKDLPDELKSTLGKFGEVKLANGLVWHPETKWHLHAWIEDDVFCYDFANGNKMILPKSRYYYVGKCKDVKLYTRTEALAKAYKTGVCGFWDFPENLN